MRTSKLIDEYAAPGGENPEDRPAAEPAGPEKRLREHAAGMLEKHPRLLLALFSAIYFSVTCTIAAVRPFWYDELFTLYLAKLPRVADIRAALAAGVDQVPLPYLLLTRASISVFGETELGARLPSVVAFWLGCVCLFQIVRRRTSVTYGWVGVAVILASSFVYRYAYEARPFGLVFGFGALGIFCWQTVADDRRRALSIAGMAVSLLAATSSHYYAVLLLGAIGAGEFVRTVARRRIDWPVWLAMLPALAPFPFAHMGKNIAMYSANFWSAPRISFFITFHNRMLEPLLLPTAALIVLLASYALWCAHRHAATPAAWPRLPPLHEIAAAAALIALPLFGYAAAILVTNALVPRYVLPSVMGWAIFYVYLLYFGSKARPAVGLIALCVLAGGAGLNTLLAAGTRWSADGASAVVNLPVPAIGQDGPIVIENPLFFFEATHRSPYHDRLHYIVDPATAHLYPYTHLDAPLEMLPRVAPVKIDRFDEFVAAHPRFVVYRQSDGAYGNGWILERLLDAGAKVEMVYKQGPGRVFTVEMPPASGR